MRVFPVNHPSLGRTPFGQMPLAARNAAARLERWKAARSEGAAPAATGAAAPGSAPGPPARPQRHDLAALAAAFPLPDRTTARGALGLPIDVPLYAVVGGTDVASAPDRLWRAWAAVRRRNADAQLLVLGDGPVPGLPGVRLLNTGISTAAVTDRPTAVVNGAGGVAAHLDACDAVVCLSRHGGPPPAVLDALARGVAVVASREAIDPALLSGVGIRVDGDNPAEVADALLTRRIGTAQWVRAATAGLSLTQPPLEAEMSRAAALG